MAEAKPDGWLSFRVIEASGLDRNELYVWSESEFEGFVKVELRGGARAIKAATSRVRVQGTGIFWNEPLILEVLPGANELRVMLCKDKITQQPDGTTKRGTQVIAACGIYMNDVVESVPVDKYFELFRPGAGGDGGFIRLSLDYSTEPPQNGAINGYGSGAGKKKRGGKIFGLLLLAGVAVAGGVLGKRYYDQQHGGGSGGGGGGAKSSSKPAAAKKK